MSSRTARVLVLLAALVAVGLFAAVRKGLVNPSASRLLPMVGIKSGPPGGRQPIRRAPEQWYQLNPEPTGADLWVIPAVDVSGLEITYAEEGAGYMSQLVQALMFCAGEPVSCPHYASSLVAFDNRGVNRWYPRLEEYGLVKLSRELKIPRVVYVELDGGPTTGTTARAFAVDVATSSIVGRWTATLPDQPPTAESMMDVQTKMAPAIVAGLCKLQNEEALFAKLRNQPPQSNPEADSSALAVPPTTSSTLASLQHLHMALKTSPTSPDLWVRLTEANHSLVQELSLDAERVWREARVRAVVAGEVARLLDPSSTSTRHAQVLGQVTLGRSGHARQLAIAEAEASADPFWRIWVATLERRPDKLPELSTSNTAASATDERIAYLRDYAIERTSRATEVEPLFEQQLKAAPYAALLYNKLGDSLNEHAEIGVARYMHAAAGLTGAVTGLIEIARQYELNGKVDDARAVAKEALGLMPGSPSCDAGGAAPSVCIAAALAQWAETGLREPAAKSMYWHPESPVNKAIQVFTAAQNRAREQFKTPESLSMRQRGSGMEYHPADWIYLAAAQLRHAAAQGIEDLRRLSPGRNYVTAHARFLQQQFPADVPVLFAVAQYHREANYDMASGDPILSIVRAFDFMYAPLRRIDIRTYSGPRAARLTALEDMRRIHPFSYWMQALVAERMEGAGAYAEAAAQYRENAVRFAPRYDDLRRSIMYQAIAEERLVTPAEVEQFSAQVPADTPEKTLFLADLYVQTGDLHRASEYYDRAFAQHLPQDSSSYSRAAFLKRRIGQPGAAIDMLLLYLKQDPSSLRSMSMMLEAAGVEESRGDLAAARRIVDRLYAQDPSPGGVMQQRAWLDWREGKTTECITEIKRSIERYPMDSTYAKLARIHIAQRDPQSARAAADLGARAANMSQNECLAVLAQIDTMEGKTADATRRLQGYASNASPLTISHQLLTRHYIAIGQPSDALKTMQNAVANSFTPDQADVLDDLARALIAAGQLDEAEKVIHRMHIMDPMGSTAGALRGEVLLLRGLAEEATSATQSGADMSFGNSLIVSAEAQLKLGNHDRALELAKRANEQYWSPQPRMLLAIGDAHQALRRNNEARTAWQDCVYFAGRDTQFGKAALERLRTGN